MAKTKISEFSTTAGNNTDINSINIAEGCAPSGINDAIRELMRQLKEFQTGGAGDSVNSGGDFSVATNKFTVASASGNTAVAGTLAVTGTTTLTGALVANGNATLGDGSGDTVTVKGTPTLEVNPTLSGGTANGVLYLNGSKVATSGSALTFDGTNLGVGTATPSTWSSKIAVVSTGTSPTVAYLNGSAASNSNTVSTEYWAANTFTGLDKIAIFGAVNPGTGNNNGNFYWSLANAGAPTEQMRLTSTGLGIGTSSPAGPLDVRAANAGGGGGIRLTSTTGTNGVNIKLNNSAGNFYFGIDTSAGGTFGNANAAVLWYDAAQPLVFATNNTKQMTLDSSGNLGLGVTPSGWASSWQSLELKQGVSIAANPAVPSGYMLTNAYYNGANFIYKVSSNGATSYNQYNGDHYWQVAGSGTAGNAITFTQAMTLDASGNLLVGTTTANAKGYIYQGTAGNDTLWVENGAGNNVFRFKAASGSDNYFDFYSGTGSGSLIFRGGGTERARIDSSGNWLVGTTSVIQSGTISLSKNGTSSNGISIQDTNSAGGVQVNFVNSSGTQCGYISHNGTTTAYNTSSDYRLKEDIQPMTGALVKVAALKPCTYKWKADGSDGEGFIAHELQAVVPQCVTGEKDAVDADGNPAYQGIDTSFLVATLTAAIQEQQALIQQLTARVAQLESN